MLGITCSLCGNTEEIDGDDDFIGDFYCSDCLREGGVDVDECFVGPNGETDLEAMDPAESWDCPNCQGESTVGEILGSGMCFDCFKETNGIADEEDEDEFEEY